MPAVWLAAGAAVVPLAAGATPAVGGAASTLAVRSSTASTLPLAPGMRTFAPPEGQVYTGVSAPIDQYETFLGAAGLRRVAIFDQYTTPNGSFGWILDELRRLGVTGMVSWSLPGNGTLQSVADGSEDAYIERQARTVAAYGRPLFIRLDWEFNGTWYPWSAVGPGGQTVPGNRPAEYVAAWRHVVDLFRGDPNVTFVWCPTLYDVSPRSGLSLGEWYPGNAYVGWIAVDAYPGSASWSWMQHGTDALDADYAFAKRTGRPMMIAEWALSSPGTGDDAALMKAFIRWMLGHPLVQAELWYDYDDAASGGANHELSAFPRSASVLRRMLQAPRILDSLAGATGGCRRRAGRRDAGRALPARAYDRPQRVDDRAVSGLGSRRASR